MEALGFGLNKVEEDDPDFYMPDGQGPIRCSLMNKHQKEIQV